MVRTAHEKLILVEDALFPASISIAVAIAVLFFSGGPSISMEELFNEERWFVIAWYFSLFGVCAINFVGVILRIKRKSLFLLFEYPSSIVMVFLMAIYIGGLAITSTTGGAALAICVAFLILLHFARSFLSIHLTYFTKK